MKNSSTTLAVGIIVLLLGRPSAGLAFQTVCHETETSAECAVVTGSGSEVAKAESNISYDLKAIWIYLSTQDALLVENGNLVKTYRISSGAPATPTPLGIFQIHTKQKLRVSGRAVPYRMPNYMAFTKNGAFGLHGLPYLGTLATNSVYWQEARSHIGTPVSHGCVRFLPEDALEIYEWADQGVPVYIQN